MKLLQALCERLTARLPVQRISGYLPWREFVRAKGMVPRGEATVAGADAP